MISYRLICKINDLEEQHITHLQWKEHVLSKIILEKEEQIDYLQKIIFEKEQSLKEGKEELYDVESDIKEEMVRFEKDAEFVTVLKREIMECKVMPSYPTSH